MISNPTLWFLQHYLWDLAHAPDHDPGLHHAWEEGYVAVNAGFADAVLAELDAEPDSAVFFHDYHLYLAPRIVRERRPETALAHFVHIPWPQPDYWHVLPSADQARDPRRAARVRPVGFHTTRWRRNFLRSCADIVGADCDFEEADGRLRRVAARAWLRRPLSVDAAEFDELALSDAVLAAGARARARRGRSSSCCASTAPTPPRTSCAAFRAFELFLEAHPELHGRVRMLALLDPSRQDIPEYAEYLGAIQRAARGA